MSKPTVIPGLTHAIVTTCTRTDYISSGVLAYVDLCFGPGDTNAIRGIPYKKIGDKTFAFQSPNTVIYKEGNKTLTTIFSGSVDTELCTLALRAMERVKELGPFKFGTRYRITDKKATEESLEKTAS